MKQERIKKLQARQRTHRLRQLFLLWLDEHHEKEISPAAGLMVLPRDRMARFKMLLS